MSIVCPSISFDLSLARSELRQKRLAGQGFKVLATSGTARFLAENGVAAEKINKVLEDRPHIEDAIRNRQVQIVFNTTDGQKAVSDSKSLRRAS
ncbi:MAG: hypothetical protein EOR99_28965 [Mesorhizobium sp.]|nr:MAG: hypothetical protein EOR99_28965 [Mesorhizobium sp.]